MAQDSILTKLHVDYVQVRKSTKWFAEQVQIMKKAKPTPRKLLGEADTVTKTVKPGSLYFFFYDPKMKDVLPYYDMFPMVFPFAPAQGGFLGLNLHYLGYPERFALFKEMLKINGSKLTDHTKMKFSWHAVSAMTQVKTAKHCVKHYLNDHVRSQFLMVEPKDWTTSMLLPVEKFVGATKEQVWRETRKP